MPSLIWDKVGSRTYESGLDRGVLYLPDGTAVPWNGLTSVVEHFDRETTPVYYDGMKTNEIVVLGDYSASLSAITYPDEFLELEGTVPFRRGVWLSDQPPKAFGLSYRTKVGDDLAGSEASYKIHIVYNVTAFPSDKTYASVSDDPSLVEFEWELSAVPEEVPGYRPTAHIILESNNFDPWLLEELEEILYGSTTTVPKLPPMQELYSYINEWYRVKIVDHGDGTWSAISDRPGFIQMMGNDMFQIVQINAVYLDEDSFEISDTVDVTDVPRMKVTDNGDGTWTAETDHTNLIEMLPDGMFALKDVELVFESENMYRITSTIDD